MTATTLGSMPFRVERNIHSFACRRPSTPQATEIKVFGLKYAVRC